MLNQIRPAIVMIVVTTAAFVLVPLGWMTTWKIQGQLPARELEQTD